jgi:hypothetical protein
MDVLNSIRYTVYDTQSSKTSRHTVEVYGDKLFSLEQAKEKVLQVKSLENLDNVTVTKVTWKNWVDNR